MVSSHSSNLQMHRRQTQDLAPLHVPQLLSHYSIQSTADRLPVLVDENTCVVVEAHHAAIRPLVLLLCAHHDCVSDISSSDFVGGGDGDSVRFCAKVALLLNDYYDAVAWIQIPVSRVPIA